MWKPRAPRIAGLSVDDGMPDHGTRYGGADTIHNTGTVDVVMIDGRVTEVWFRCVQLSARVSVRVAGVKHGSYEVEGEPLVAVELADATG